jgi:hypothetical protein
MALLEVLHVHKVTATVEFEEPIALDVDRYAAFIEASADDVINRALEYVFAKDKDFQKHLAANAETTVVRSLQVKELRGSGKPIKASKRPASLAVKS